MSNSVQILDALREGEPLSLSALAYEADTATYDTEVTIGKLIAQGRVYIDRDGAIRRTSMQCVRDKRYMEGRK